MVDEGESQPRSLDSFKWPIIHTVAELRRLLDTPNRPTVLIAMEFSGALRSALEAQDNVALSVDFRLCKGGSMYYYMGDVRDVVGLQWWDRIYFFPPCFHQLKGDTECL